jgi:uncharacterized protein (TIGR00369 family)
MPWDPMWNGPRTGDAWLEYCNEHPASKVVGLTAVQTDGQAMRFRLVEAPAMNLNGSIHGGMLAAALDNALAQTAMTGMPDDGLPNTAGMNVQYLRPAIPPLDILVRVTRGGRRMVFVRAEVFTKRDVLCATADGTFAVVKPDHVAPRQ